MESSAPSVSVPFRERPIFRLLRDYARADPSCGRESMQRMFEEDLSLARYTAARTPP